MSAVAPADVNAANIANKTIEKMAGESTDLVMKILACVFICLSASMITIYIAYFNYPDENGKKDVTKNTTDTQTVKLDEPPNPHDQNGNKQGNGLEDAKKDEQNQHRNGDDKAENKKNTGQEKPDPQSSLPKPAGIHGQTGASAMTIGRGSLTDPKKYKSTNLSSASTETGKKKHLTWPPCDLSTKHSSGVSKEIIKGKPKKKQRSLLLSTQLSNGASSGQSTPEKNKESPKNGSDEPGPQAANSGSSAGKTENTTGPELIDEKTAEELAHEISNADSIGAMFELIEKFIKKYKKFEKFFTFPSGGKLNAFIQQYQNNTDLKDRAIIVCWVLYFLRNSKLSNLFEKLAEAGKGELNMSDNANFEALKKVRNSIGGQRTSTEGIAGLVNGVMPRNAKPEEVTDKIVKEENDQERFKIAFLIALQKWCPVFIEHASETTKLERLQEMLEQEVDKDTKVLSKFTNLIEKTAAKLAPPSSSEFGTFIIPIAAPDMSELPFTGTSI